MLRRFIRKLARSHLPAIIRYVIGMAAMFLVTAVWVGALLGLPLIVAWARGW